MARGKRGRPAKKNRSINMTFRKILLTFLVMTIGVSCSYAKKEPKYEQARQLTADQTALVQKAITQEKVLIAPLSWKLIFKTRGRT
jgi:hypothetical protein